jgi:hypothetical protein
LLFVCVDRLDFPEPEVHVELERHLLSMLRSYFESRALAHEPFRCVPERLMKSALRVVTEELGDFDSIFILLVLALGADHALVDWTAPMVRRVSVDNLKVYCEYATNMAFERSNREYFEGLIKGNISCLR